MSQVDPSDFIVYSRSYRPDPCSPIEKELTDIYYIDGDRASKVLYFNDGGDILCYGKEITPVSDLRLFNKLLKHAGKDYRYEETDFMFVRAPCKPVHRVPRTIEEIMDLSEKNFFDSDCLDNSN